jgi:hypothetical protein
MGMASGSDRRPVRSRLGGAAPRDVVGDLKLPSTRASCVFGVAEPLLLGVLLLVEPALSSPNAGVGSRSGACSAMAAGICGLLLIDLVKTSADSRQR